MRFKIGDIVVFIETANHFSLTYGKSYKIVDLTDRNDEVYLYVHNDKGDICNYYPKRFISAVEFRRRIIDDILE